MRKHMLFAASAAGLFMASAASAEVAFTAGTDLNLRSGPGGNYEVLVNDRVVASNAVLSKWISVKYDRGQPDPRDRQRPGRYDRNEYDPYDVPRQPWRKPQRKMGTAVEPDDSHSSRVDSPD